MKRIKGYLKVILGSLIIAIALNLFFTKYKIVPVGLFGFSVLYNLKVNMDLSLTFFLINILFISIGALTLQKNQIKRSIITAILIPIFILITKDIFKIIDITSADMLLIALFGGILIGYASRLIYQEDRFVSGDDIICQISKSIVGPNGKIANYIIDIILLFFVTINFGFENALYSVVSIIAIEIFNKRSILGISRSKVFYIITSEEQKVRRFIINDLKCDLTIFDAKGGYSKNKTSILMCAIKTKDYYKLREGIHQIDPYAFISITDSYELVNENLTLLNK